MNKTDHIRRAIADEIRELELREWRKYMAREKRKRAALEYIAETQKTYPIYFISGDSETEM